MEFPTHQTIRNPLGNKNDKFTFSEYFYKGYNFPAVNDAEGFYDFAEEQAVEKIKEADNWEDLKKECETILDLIILMVEQYRRKNKLPRMFHPSNDMINEILAPYYAWCIKGGNKMYKSTEDPDRHQFFALIDWVTCIEILLKGNVIKNNRMNGPLHRTFIGFKSREEIKKMFYSQ